MPGDPTAYLAPGVLGGGGSAPMVASATGAAQPGSHWSFILWLVVIGVLVPVAVLGGLQVGGFSFVFRHR